MTPCAETWGKEEDKQIKPLNLWKLQTTIHLKKSAVHMFQESEAS